MTERKRRPTLRRSLGGLVGFVLAGAFGMLPGAAAGQTVKEIPLPVAGSAPLDIAAGPDESVWFTEQHGDRIGRVSRCGELSEFALPTTGNFLRGIAADPDGTLWFTELVEIGRITTAGAITEYTIPGGVSEPIEIVPGADGNLWFTEYYNRIGRMTPAGLVTLFPIPTASSAPRFITAGPDASLWFTESGANKIGRITTSGAISEFPLPAPVGPFGIASGPDGNIWLTESSVNRIGRMTTSGELAEFRSRGAEAARQPLRQAGTGISGLRKPMRTRWPGSRRRAWSRSLPCPLPRAVPTGSWKVRTATSGSRKTPPTRWRDSGSARLPVLVRAPSLSMARERVPCHSTSYFFAGAFPPSAGRAGSNASSSVAAE